MMPHTIAASYLYCRKGSSDKEYDLFILQDGAIYTVQANYGRRGSLLKTIVKCRTHSINDAWGVYNNIYAEKIAKGYRENIASVIELVMDINKPHTPTPPAIVKPKPKTKITRTITLEEI